MTDETEPQPTPPALSAEEEAKALRDLLDEGAEPDEDRPLGILRSRYRPADRPRPSPPPTSPAPPPPPPAPPTPPPAE
ncbi:hypothetical protein [Streptomyces akebiae]|uniref:Uncharacterized protein n=1 Tax=Streptomyces akebiae TaxID=2865673 RepID=A0ABX8XIU1_9ACTN|nr:hypothetical protein [Streptomyces akebiae]QYX75523.1 hypothetical protein K1J60_02435 [Streptomyces akebiae]